jgi:hypothetical protein
MRQYVFGLAAAVAVAASSAPAMAGCGSCGPSYSYAPAVSFNYGYGGGCAQAFANPCTYGAANWAVATVPAPVTYYAVQPQYYYVNQGPTYTGPGMYAPSVAYQARSVGGWSGYQVGYYGYSGGPYANPTSHYYQGMPATTVPTVYSYRRAYRPARYSYAPRYLAPRVYRSHRAWGPRVYAPSLRYGHRVAPRYSVAPPQYRQRQWRVYK